MIKVPYLGSLIPQVLPSLVLFFSLMFGVLSLLKLKSKAIKAFRSASASPEEASIASKDLQKDESRTVLEAIIKGERAILQEISLERTKAERNRLLRFNLPP